MVGYRMQGVSGRKVRVCGEGGETYKKSMYRTNDDIRLQNVVSCDREIQGKTYCIKSYSVL